MIAHLRGRLISKTPGQAIVEAAGVGYDVTISIPTFSELPAAGNDVYLSFRNRKITRIDVPDNIADGARTQAPGDITFPLVLQYVDDMLTVTDDELLRAMFVLWERLRTIVEPTGALGACALLEKKLDASGKRVGVLLSGGNVDLGWAASAWRARS